MAFLFDETGKLRKTICFSNKSSKGIFLNGDNLTGEGDGDDEIITVDLEKLPDWVRRISLGANIFAAKLKLCVGGKGFLKGEWSVYQNCKLCDETGNLQM